MELSIALGESPQTLTNWAKRGVSKAGAIKAAAAFSVSLVWLMSGDGEARPHAIRQSNVTKQCKNFVF